MTTPPVDLLGQMVDALADAPADFRVAWVLSLVRALEQMDPGDWPRLVAELAAEIAALAALADD